MDAFEKKVARAIKLLQSIPQDGEIEVSYSGGKDSDVILELAKMAGSGMLGGCSPENDGKGFRLSPLFTEEMMGFPLMWTTLPFLSQSGGQNP